MYSTSLNDHAMSDPDVQARDLNQEPTIGDLLNDPIAQLLMQKDGVRAESLEPILEQIALSLSAKAIA